ncbi:MAG: 23S rRNA (guanosine(2251)-2'-O)-methyltransferase RlmB [Gammaproteobacteria bacterium]|nr:23S rRNA (guanosine(2251)-2'-O)-methyltransferase RlmB [Gammaproteobacteria bacterium]
MKLDIIFGLHAVESLVKNNREGITELLVLKGRHDKRLSRLLRQAKGLPSRQLNRRELDKIANSETHQGIIAYVSSAAGDSQDQLIKENTLPSFIESIQGAPLILLLDGVTDPHNFGACLRTADAAGVHLVIMPRDRSVGLTPVVRKVASGAAETVPVCQVTNLARAMETLKDAGIWIAGAAGEATNSFCDVDYKGPIAIVMGSEGSGLRRLTREKCDYLIKIPMAGEVSSLNVSVATGICLYEVVRQRINLMKEQA